ncbi:hypothetical protein GCM10009122_23090 [Fulvivirga kasyanovii]|uniref:Uncharacterized protein n=1 Tax=Fulvivirga kasyanovii TaxID=396812 RepID=A0ABW9RZX9_9BACT|nr:hypothetical protein [Fulvivirga kasyanovii]MTI28984.1 hypothetical protein [Fulvivirga kasyanovii]
MVLQTTFIRFDEIFNEEMRTVDEYFKDLPKRGILISLVEWVNSSLFFYATGPEGDGQFELLDAIILPASNIIAKQNLYALKEYGKSRKIKYVWLTPYTSFMVMEHLLSKYAHEIFENGIFDYEKAKQEQRDLLHSELSLEFLKGYLTFSHKRIDKLKTSPNDDYENQIINQVTDRIGTYEYESLEYIYTYHVEFKKSVEFFLFLKSNYGNALGSFLRTRGLNKWEEYPLKLSGFTWGFMRDFRVRVNSGNEKKVDLKFFDTFVSGEVFTELEDNFKLLKKFPLVKYAQDGYLSLFRDFTFEKIYKTLYFDVTGEAVKIDPSLTKSKLGKAFFEEWLCTKYVNEIFSEPKAINLEETNPVFTNAENKPDHYTRKWNDVFVFEYKDTLIADLAKTSYNPEEVISELKDKLYLKTKNQKKPKRSAVLQLADFILNYESNYHLFDPNAKLKKLTFYPILVVQDRCLTTPGVNQILNRWFMEEVEKSGKKLKIKPLIVISIDSLILGMEFLKENIGEFKACINEYIKIENKLKREKRIPISFESWFKRKYLHHPSRKKQFFTFLEESGKRLSEDLRAAVHGSK